MTLLQQFRRRIAKVGRWVSSVSLLSIVILTFRGWWVKQDDRDKDTIGLDDIGLVAGSMMIMMGGGPGTVGGGGGGPISTSRDLTSRRRRAMASRLWSH
jgi:hypothetical protein